MLHKEKQGKIKGVEVDYYKMSGSRENGCWRSRILLERRTAMIRKSRQKTERPEQLHQKEIKEEKQD